MSNNQKKTRIDYRRCAKMEIYPYYHSHFFTNCESIHIYTGK